jgi:acyl-CoA oxidase
MVYQISLFLRCIFYRTTPLGFLLTSIPKTFTSWPTTQQQTGPKIGYNNQDNGFCRFDRVRIPRTNMAMRYATLSRDGKYTAAAKRKQASYSTMTLVRASIVIDSGQALSAAATIAIRYSAVREQGFSGRGDGSEMCVLDYPMQQARLFPFLASAFAFHFTGVSMTTLLRSEDIAALHLASSGLKALCSKLTCLGIEACRQACGGHGYLLASGLPELLGTYKQTATVEGENYMIAQQTTKALLKMLRGRPGKSAAAVVAAAAAASTSASPSSSVLHGKDTDYVAHAAHIARHDRNAATGVADVMDPAWQVRAYRQRAAWILVDLEAKLTAVQASTCSGGMNAADAWIAFCPDIVRASEAHCLYVLVRNFALAVEQLEREGSALAAVLGEQRDLFALWWMQERSGEFFESGFLAHPEQAQFVREGVRRRLQSVRPNAVALVDGWGHSDHMLHSALGRRDGKVYEALWRSAQSDVNPMNRDAVDPVFEESLLPMRQALAKL